MEESTFAMSIETFKRRLREEMEQICSERGWDYSNNKHRGTAFQLWFADVLIRANRGIETPIDDACVETGDLSGDVVVEDPLAERIYIAECRHSSSDAGKPIPDQQIEAFVGSHDRLKDPNYVRAHGSSQTIELLGDYGDLMVKGYTATYYFVTTRSKTAGTDAIVSKANAQYADRGESVSYVVLDLQELREFYLRTTSLEGSVGVTVDAPLPADSYFTRSDPYPTLVAAVKANWIRNIYQRAGARERIFALNIRDWLGKRNNINRQIVETAEKEAENFFYFNNGISAVCTELGVDTAKHHLHAVDFQIINGAQTVGAIVDARPCDDAYVLLRVTQAATSKSMAKPINEKIIRYNNSQNVVRVADFRSNDTIQQFLEKELGKHHHRPHLPMITYQRKRGAATKPRKGSRLLRMEDLGKIRYAFEVEPTLVINSPKDLFTSKAEHSEGAYELAFGVKGRLEAIWTQETLNRCLLALAFFFRTEEAANTARKGDESLAFLGQLKYHVVSLAGEVCRREYMAAKIQDLISSEKAFDKEWEGIWRTALGVLRSERKRSLQASDPVGLRTFARSRETWQIVSELFHDLRSGGGMDR